MLRYSLNVTAANNAPQTNTQAFMSVQVHNMARPIPSPKSRGYGYYLMRLRQHAAEANTKREKLLVHDWVAPEVHCVPILQRQPHPGPR